MATPDQINAFKQILNKWKSFDFKKVYREELGEASISGTLSPIIEQLTSKLVLAEGVIESISSNKLIEYYNTFHLILNRLDQIKGLNEAEFINSKASLIGEINALNEKILDLWPNIASLINYNSYNDPKSQAKKLNAILEKSEKDSEIIHDFKIKLATELDDFENRHKTNFLKAEIYTQTGIFYNEANNYFRNSKIWLWGVIISSLVLIGVLFVIFNNFCFELKCFNNLKTLNYQTVCDGCNKSILYLEIFKAVTYRVLMISFIVYIINFCVKNYNASMHNYTINSQKANSLNAAKFLLERAKTDEGNDNIMNQAANAIFSHQPTGYSSKDPENIVSSITNKIIDKANPIKE